MIDAVDALDNLCDEWPDEPLGWLTLADKREVAEMVLRHLRSRPVEERMALMGMVFYGEVTGWPRPHLPLCLGVIRCDGCEQPIGLDDIVAGDADHTWHLRCEPERAGQDVIADDDIEASAAEVREALRFLRAHKCQCCGQFRTNCVCWGSFGTHGSSHCTPQTHGRDRYGW